MDSRKKSPEAEHFGASDYNWLQCPTDGYEAASARRATGELAKSVFILLLDCQACATSRVNSAQLGRRSNNSSKALRPTTPRSVTALLSDQAPRSSARRRPAAQSPGSMICPQPAAAMVSADSHSR